MARLYELTQCYKALEALAEDEAQDEQFLQVADGLHGEIQDKATNIAMLILNMESTADAIKQAETRMSERRKAIEARAARIREYLLQNMLTCEVHSVECDYFKMSVRETPMSVVVDDQSLIPAEYMRTPEPPLPAPDKKKIVDDIKQGVVIEGVHTERRKYLHIK